MRLFIYPFDYSIAIPAITGQGAKSVMAFSCSRLHTRRRERKL